MPSSAARAGTPGRSGRSLQPRAPLVVMATPASTSSTASTVALGSPSSSIECEDDQEHVSLLLHDSNPKRSKNERSTAHDGALRKSSSAHKHNRSQHPSSRSSYKQQHQKQYTRAHADDLECGERTERDANDNSHEWQVLRDLSHCVSTSSDDYALQLVHLRHANFGLRWQQRDSTTAAAPLCVVGPHWWLMASTFTVFTVAAATITTLTAPQAGAGESLTGILLSGACLTMYALVGCVDPGIVPRIDAPLDDTYSYCDECASYRPEGALHCMDCRACIEGYDHHCPWTGKCVGRRNVRYFYAWLVFLVLAFVYEVIEFTTYVLPPDDQPVPTFYDDDSSSGSSTSAPVLLRVLSGVKSH